MFLLLAVRGEIEKPSLLLLLMRSSRVVAAAAVAVADAMLLLAVPLFLHLFFSHFIVITDRDWMGTDPRSGRTDGPVHDGATDYTIRRRQRGRMGVAG